MCGELCKQITADFTRVGTRGKVRGEQGEAKTHHFADPSYQSGLPLCRGSLMGPPATPRSSSLHPSWRQQTAISHQMSP